MPKIILSFLILAGMAMAGGAVWFLANRPVESLPQSDNQAGEKLDQQPIAPVVIINGVELELEIMRTPEEQARGLSGRESLEENAGMLFVYDEQATPSFWMKEMNFPIDIIWIGSDGRIVDISENLAPDTFPQLFHPRALVQYVLEVNASWAKTYDVTIGDPVEFRFDL